MAKALVRSYALTNQGTNGDLMTTEQPELEKHVTETNCPKCGSGALVAHVDANGILVLETCNACDFKNQVVKTEDKSSKAAKSK